MTPPALLILAASTLLAVAGTAVVAQQDSGVPNVQDTLADVQCNYTTTKPTPQVNMYHYNTCVVAKFAAYLNIGQGQYIELNNGHVDQNKSSCETNTTNPKLVVGFDCASLEFEISNNNTKVFVSSINGLYIVGNKTAGNQVPFSSVSQNLFSTTQPGHYYKCNTEQVVNLNKPNATLVLSNFAYEAYRTATGTDFYQIPEECALDSGPVSDWVRIGVGICLIALVAIVLIAYFIGRRRWSERSSYESV